MKTYTVWFKWRSEKDSTCIFVSGVPGEKLAENISLALVEEGFVTVAWIEEE